MIIFDVLFSVLNSIFTFVKPIIILVGLFCFVLFALFIVNCLICKRKGIYFKGEPKKRVKDKEPNFFKKIFVLFPQRLAKDFMLKNPNAFPYKGMVIFTGMQGNGKTIALVKYINDMKKKFPDVNVITNLDYAYEDQRLRHWKQLTTYNNGEKGVIVGMDETQNWFSSAQSKNFPPEMLSVVTQNRKNRRIILGTAQNFYMLAKNIRTQCTEVRDCKTLFGCLTIVTCKIPVCDTDGSVVEWHKLGRYFFVHDDKLRESYDTYKVIQSLSDSGFVDKNVNAV